MVDENEGDSSLVVIENEVKTPSTPVKFYEQTMTSSVGGTHVKPSLTQTKQRDIEENGKSPVKKVDHDTYSSDDSKLQMQMHHRTTEELLTININNPTRNDSSNVKLQNLNSLNTLTQLNQTVTSNLIANGASATGTATNFNTKQ